MSSASNDIFASFFPIWMPFISFSCLIVVSRMSHTMLNRSGEKRYSCLVPDLNGKAFSFCPLSMMLAVVCHIWPSLCWGTPSTASTPTLLGVFIMNGCRTLSSAFSESIDMFMCFLSFILFMWCITFIDLRILYHPCILGMNATWSWCMIFLMYCWMWFANILLRILASMFVSDNGLKFHSLLCIFLVLGLGWCWLCEMSLGVFYLLEFFEIITGGIGVISPLNAL